VDVRVDAECRVCTELDLDLQEVKMRYFCEGVHWTRYFCQGVDGLFMEAGIDGD
jgi:hypothetical protein